MEMDPLVPDLWQAISDLISSDKLNIWVCTPRVSGVAGGIEGLASVFVFSFRGAACVASHLLPR